MFEAISVFLVFNQVIRFQINRKTILYLRSPDFYFLITIIKVCPEITIDTKLPSCSPDWESCVLEYNISL